MNWYQLADVKVVKDLKIPNKGVDVDSSTFERVLSIVFPVVGAIVLIFLILAGLKYVLSRGNPSETAKAKNAIIYAVVGLIITLLSYSIVTFVIKGLG